MTKFSSFPLGAGPRDGLMVLLTKLFNKPLFIVRIFLDLGVSLLGYFMSGPLGFGSIISALGLGYSIHFFFKLNKFDSKSKQMNILELIQLLRNKA